MASLTILFRFRIAQQFCQRDRIGRVAPATVHSTLLPSRPPGGSIASMHSFRL
jgi:hypothetical protein